MKRNDLAIILTGMVVVLLLVVPHAESAIPPTPAFKFFNTTSGANNVTAFFSDDTLTLVAGSGVSITPDNTNKQITFSTTGTGSTIIIKSADETINNSAALQDDNELRFSVAANTIYTGELRLFYDTTPTSANFKYDFTVPTGTTGHKLAPTTVYRAGVNNPYEAFTTTAAVTPSSSAQTLATFFTIQTNSTAGEVVFRWAQNTAHASDTTVKKGSMLVVYEG